MRTQEKDVLTLKDKKKKYIARHPLGKLTINQLKEKAIKEDIFVYGDKAQILQCFDQSKLMLELFRIQKEK